VGFRSCPYHAHHKRPSRYVWTSPPHRHTTLACTPFANTMKGEKGTPGEKWMDSDGEQSSG
jgi:hypothetical protein